MKSDQLHRFILALIAVGVSGLALGGLMFHRVPESNREALFLALGLVLGLATSAYAFYFGASKGGSDLADRQATIVENAAATPATVTIDQPADKPVPVEPTEPQQ